MDEIINRFTPFFQKQKINNNKICNHNIVQNDEQTYCINCGQVFKIGSTENDYNTFLDTHTIQHIPYKRISHFKAVLLKCQGIQETKFKNEIYDLLKANIKEKTKSEVIRVLKENKYLKDVKHSNYYLNALGGQSIILTSIQNENLLDMFKRIQLPYDEWNKVKKRKNFLNYQFIIKKLYELNGINSKDIPELLTEKFLIEHYNAWKFICKYNHWNFICKHENIKPFLVDINNENKNRIN